MRELSLNVMDIVQNSISAGATVIKISVLEEAQKLTIVVTDNGKGMSKEQVCKVIDPFFTTRTTRKVGMGIPLFKMEAEMTGGSFEIESDLNQGTKVTATFITTHLDMLPLGDINANCMVTDYLQSGFRFYFLSKNRAFGFYFEYKGTKRYFGRNSSECT
ncbi:MAG: ATP-binding protein [Eubacteriales bacterium]